MARLSKFTSVNLNESYGKSGQARPAGSAASAANPLRQRSLPTHGGMLVLSWPCRQQSAGIKSGKIGVTSSPKLAAPLLEHPVSDPVDSPAISPLVPGWLRNSQQQQQKTVEPPASCAENRSIHETLLSERSEGLSVALDGGSARNFGVDSATDFIRPSVYVPPNRRTAQANEGITPTQPPPSQPEKVVVIRGEEFPTLQSSVVRPLTPPQRQREVPKKQREEMTEQQLKLQQISLQAQAEKQNGCGEGLKLQPAQPLRLQGKGAPSTSERLVLPTDARQGESKDVNVFSTPPPLVRLDHVSNWADDEREGRQNYSSHEPDHSMPEEKPLHFIPPYDVPSYGNNLADAKKSFEQANAVASESLNVKQAKRAYVPPFAREGKISKDHALPREGLLSKDESVASDSRDRAYEHLCDNRTESTIGKEKIGKEACNLFETFSDDNSGRRNEEDSQYKQGLIGGSDSDTNTYNKVSSHGMRFSPPEMQFGRQHGYHPQAEEQFGGRNEVRLGYGQKASRSSCTESWNLGRETTHYGTRRMAFPHENHTFLLEKASLEAEKRAEEERFKKEENNYRNTRASKEEIFFSEADLIRTQRFLDEEKHTRFDSKEFETRQAQEKARHYGYSTVEESRYLHGMEYKGYPARTEHNVPENWMAEEERRVYGQERREYVTCKFNEQEENGSQRVVDERNWGEKFDLRRKNEALPVDANYASLSQQREEKVGSFSIEPEWDHLVSSFGGPGQSGNEYQLRPSSAGSSSSTQWSRSTPEEFSNHLNLKSARTSVSTTGLRDSKARGEPRSICSRTVSWRRDTNANGNTANPKLFSFPIESTTMYQSTDSGSFKLF